MSSSHPTQNQAQRSDLIRTRVELAEKIAADWNEAGLSYSIAHGIDNYPEQIGRDLDVLITPTHVERALSIATRHLTEAGYEVLRPPSIWGKRILAYRGGNWDDTFEVHTMTTITWRHCVLAAAAKSGNKNGPFAIDPWAAFAKRILLPLLSRGVTPFAEKPAKLAVAQDELSAAAAGLRPWLGPPLAEQLLSHIAKKRLDHLEAQLPVIRRAFLRRAWSRQPIGAAGALLSLVGRRFAQFFSPCGPIVALVGPDGVGKSSVLRELTQGERSLFSAIVVRHWRPTLLPPLGSLAGKPPQRPPPGATVAPRRKPGRFQVLRLLYYWVDFVLGYYVKDRVDSSRQKLVLYDRCALDMAIDPVRYGLRSDKGVRLLWRLSPKPDLVILLHDTPERIHNRKAELPLAEIEAQLCAWSQFVESGQVEEQILIDAGPPEIADRIRRLCLHALFDRRTVS